MADQSTRLVGVHEIPPFVIERIELPGGPAVGPLVPGELTSPSKPANAV